MSEKAFRTVWSFFALLAFAFGATSALRTTGSDVSAYIIPLGSSDPFSAALVAWPLEAGLTAVVLLLTTTYVRVFGMVRGPRWEQRLPVFYFDSADVDPATTLGAVYQRAALTVLVGLPLVFQLVLLSKAWHGTAYEPGGVAFASGWRHFTPERAVNWSSALSGLYRFGKAGEGATYYPWLSAYGYLLGEFALIWCAWRAVKLAVTAHK